MIYHIEKLEEYDDRLIERLAEMEKAYFSDAWSDSSISDTLARDYNMLIIAGEQDAAYEIGMDVEIDIPTDMSVCKGYLIANLIAGESELLRIAVDESCRGAGIGSRLMERYFEELQNNCERSILEVRESNAAARSLYERFGYQKLGVRKKYYHNPVEDAVIYECMRIQ